MLSKELLLAKELIYDPCGFICSEAVAETESKKYNAHTFTINNHLVCYRLAKITPTKTGQFVTLWKRIPKGPIAPFHIEDGIGFFIISCQKDNNFGQFIFPKAVLHNKGILSDELKEGKRAMRVYPPWDKTLNTQAKKTQQWQLDYFVQISEDKPIDMTLVKKYFTIE
ncbi:MepB family protein [Flavobacterium sp. W1B]|uniref:MepB family protein n=1 Tax=Flavobacterium sp. W1B TaxID=3394146 RepID=UPI0039BCDDF6